MDLSRMLPALLLSATWLLSACASRKYKDIPNPAPEPTAKHLEYAEKEGYPATTLRALAYGRRLYVNRCAGCHELYPPSAYKAKKWPRIVQDMAINAGIGEDQVRDIARYLAAMAAAQEDAAGGTRAPAR